MEEEIKYPDDPELLEEELRKIGSPLAKFVPPPKVLSVNFNQDMGCFICSTEDGVRLYNTDPLAEHNRIPFDVAGSVAQAQMIYRSNLVGLVAGGSRPKFPDNFLHIYCFKHNKFIRAVELHSSIRAFRMRKDMLVVASLNHIHGFSFPEPIEILFTLEVPTNSRGLLEISPMASCEKQIIVFPGQKVGSLHIVEIEYIQNAVQTLPSNMLKQSHQKGDNALPVIQAHEGELCCIALSQQGTKLATASSHGTLIRIWDTVTRTQIVELRRGSDQATIYSVCFSLNTEYLACSSDKGTLHVFAIEKLNLNKRLNVPNASNVLGKYGESLWAFANIILPPECPSIVGFGENNTVVGLGMDGTFHQYSFSEDGTCTRKIYDLYLNASDARIINASISEENP